MSEEINDGSIKNLPSRIVQIQATVMPATLNNGEHVQLFALCEDGSLWMKFHAWHGMNVPTHGRWFAEEPAPLHVSGPIRELREQRDALLAALKEADQYFTDKGLYLLQKKCRAAIARAEGGGNC